jgi:SAM-dependent methyltransferase
VEGRVELPDGSVDCVVLTEVLEHIYEPGLALRELHRLLRPGGILMGSVPFARGEHEAPHDYYRYTSFALRRLLADAGFEVSRVDYIGDLAGVMVTSFAAALDVLPRGLRRLRLGFLALPLTLLFRVPEFVYYGALRLGLDPGRLAYFRQYPLGFTFLAVKPRSGP